MNNFAHITQKQCIAYVLPSNRNSKQCRLGNTAVLFFLGKILYGGLTLAAPSIRHDMHGGAPRDGHGIYSASRVSASQMFGVYNAFS